MLALRSAWLRYCHCLKLPCASRYALEVKSESTALDDGLMARVDLLLAAEGMVKSSKISDLPMEVVVLPVVAGESLDGGGVQISLRRGGEGVLGAATGTLAEGLEFRAGGLFAFCTVS